MTRRLLDLNAACIRIFSRDEKKQDDMRREFASDRLEFVIGDVRDYDSVRKAVHDTSYVFHAAALKQVPSCEFFPLEAVKTNVLGTANVMRAIEEVGIENSAVILSTDKAVYPINVMGQTKALAEKMALAAVRGNEYGPDINVTRYGNVLGSRGSVVPLFVEQIKAGKALTVTNPEMTRFMLTLDNAVDLVLKAFNAKVRDENGVIACDRGSIFVPKAPACSILTLVEALGQIVGRPLPCHVIGTRHGEKQHEALLAAEEIARASDEGDYLRVPLDTRDLNYASYFEAGVEQKKAEAYTSQNTRQLMVSETVELLKNVDCVKEMLK
jgi:UDP-glucose 4-epimerase